MKEINDFLLNLYTTGIKDRYRTEIMFPNLKNGIVTALDLYSIIMIPENELCLKYSTNPKYPDAQRIISEFESKKRKSIKVKISDLAKEISKARIVIDKVSIGCEECKGSGEVTFEYEDKKGEIHDIEGDCPICNGEGEVVLKSNFARVKLDSKRSGRDKTYFINIEGLNFHPFQIYKLFMVGLTKGCDFIEIFYSKEDSQRTMSYFGNIKVLTNLINV